jgi:poly-gamma-glutamate synthesis protein (capsule biosynthesis protein)
VVVAALALAVGGAGLLYAGAGGRAPAVQAAAPVATSTTTTTPATTTTTAPPLRRATIAFGGDVLIHSNVSTAAQTPEGHDFSPMLAPIARRITGADLAICHLEVTLNRASEPLSGYPRFRAPRELAADLAEAGFDGCSVASNHALDFGESGVVATLDALDDAGLAHVGTARSPEGRVPALYEANGIQVAQLSYAYGFNGFTRPAGKEWLVDQIDPTLILADARAARAAGAELVVVSLHWGNEYVHDVVAAQQAVADALASESGVVDLVVGHHAHVVQPISKVGSMWVVWGMGNLLSANSPRCCTTEATDGVVVTVTVGDRAPGGPVGVTGVAFTPTWNERSTYRVLPVAETLAAGTDAAHTTDLEASLYRTTAHILALGGSDLGVTRADDPAKPVPPVARQ